MDFVNLNWHLIFFLIDVCSWILIGYLVNTFTEIVSPKNTKASLDIRYPTASFLGGMIAITVNALPESGISLPSFMYAFLAAIFIFFLKKAAEPEIIGGKLNRKRTISRFVSERR